MAIDFSGYDQALTQAGIDPEQAGRLLNFARKIPGLMPEGGFGPASSTPSAPPYLRTPEPGSMINFGGGQTKPAPPTAAPPQQRPMINFGGGQPATSKGPAETQLEQLEQQGRPELHGAKKWLDIAGQALVPKLEQAIPGTPGNYDARLARAEQGAEGEISRAGQAQTQAEAKTRAEQTAQTATPEARRQFMEQNPDLFQDVTDFEKNDYILSGKFPQREPVEKTGKPDVIETEKGPLQYNPEKKAWEPVMLGGQPVGPKQTAKHVAGEVRYDEGIPTGVYGQGDQLYRAGDPNMPAELKAALADANKAHGQSVQEKKDIQASGADVRGKSYGRNRPVQVLDVWNGNRPVTVSAGEAEDNPDRYVTQSGGEKALPREALINDIRVSAGNVQKNLDVLDEKGLDRATLAAALANPGTTFEAYLQALPRGALGEREQQFVSDLFNLREQAMAMRSVLGAGQGSEDVRAAILNTLPGISSGSKGFGQKQVTNMLQVLQRLEQGVPSVPLRGGPQDRSAAPGTATGGFAEWKKARGR